MKVIADVLITAAGFGLFALLHTLLARRKIKRALFEKYPGIRRFYRALYSLLSLLLLGSWYIFSPFPEGMVYRLVVPYSLLFWILQVIGVAGMLLSLRNINPGVFIGWNQLRNISEEDQLVTDGLYSYARHPLYSATMMVFIFNPVMSAKWMIITLLIGIYCWIGSIFEEKNLIATFGEQYLAYKKEVPRFIPKIHLF